jgi:glutathione peroxidase-family protein
MEPLYQTVPPFIVRIYADYFSIIWEGFEELEEDRYNYEFVKSIRIDYNPKREHELRKKIWPSILEFVLGRYNTSGSIEDKMDFSEFLIEMKDGDVKKRYLNNADPENLREAIEMIRARL